MTAPTPGTPFELGNDGPSVLLVGVDGSPTSLRAASYTAGLARRQRCRLVVVHVGSRPAMSGLSPYAVPYIDESLDKIAEDLSQQVEAGAAYIGVEAEFLSVRGDPYSEIVRVADEIRADAVFVGASASAGHKLVGSLAVRLVRAGKWPVTVVP
jgi:nucleotide-binding universal stress UspA family protein